MRLCAETRATLRLCPLLADFVAGSAQHELHMSPRIDAQLVLRGPLGVLLGKASASE